ncbi:MAG: 16S rRNA (cytosine(967)-C(5))-methyltransferase RsmB [Deltaproteobacteria bacterium]|nr:16S rRNA (cytosine(967)-C(5))-methyltransferase RsmB [Deltaproteobacteria bacterium]
MRQRPKEQPATDARSLAWDILQLVEGGGFADALLGERLNRCRLDVRDQGLATQLVYGTLAWQGFLDHIIAAFAMRAPAALDLPVRVVLRLALFQICILTRIPGFAAVDTAVNLIKRYRGGAATSFVNAVLRRAAGGWRGVPLPSRQTDPVGRLSVELSHPRWLVERWVAALGLDETESLLRADNEPAPTVLRANRRVVDTPALVERLSAAGITVSQTTYSPVGLRIDGGGAPERLPGYDEGKFSVQGEASQLIGLLAGSRPGARILDACAAPGGKATHLAELMDDQGDVVAIDTNSAGIERLRKQAQRLGLRSIRCIVGDAMQWKDEGNGFDCVLVDAPCSGLGTLRQHPEVRWRRTAADVDELAQLQSRLLQRLSLLVRPGGVLVYATCTLMPEENDAVIDAALRELPQFEVVDPRPLLPEAARELIGDDFRLRTFPHRQTLDGFFAVRLQRRKAHGIVAA